MEFIRKIQPTASDVHVNRPLSNLSLAFFQSAENFVADQVFPMVPGSNQSDQYFTYDRGMFNRNQMEKVAEGAETKGVGYSVSTDNYFADVWGLHHDISDRRRANADANFNLDREATELLTHQALINREAEWTSNFFVSGQWTTDVTLAGANQWSDASSDPFGDIETAKDTILSSTGFLPNTLVLGYTTWRTLKDHPDIVDRIKYGQTPGAPARATRDTVASLFEFDRVLVSMAIQNTANEGATNAHSKIAADNALICYVPPNPGLYVPSAGYTFTWTGLLGTANNGIRIMRMRNELAKSDRIELEQAYDQKLVSADLGYLILDTAA